MAKRKVLLTGASGSMGGEALKELLRRRDKYDIRLLLRPSKANKKDFKEYETTEGVEISWGDLTKPEDVAVFFIVLKLDRWLNLKRQNKNPSNESIEDTVIDLMNYIEIKEALENESTTT